MSIRITAATVILATTAGLSYANAQDGTLIGLQGVANGEFDLVTVQLSTGQVTTIARETELGLCSSLPPMATTA